MALLKYLPPTWQQKYAKFWFNDKRRRSFYMKVAELNRNGMKIDEIMASLYMRESKKNKDSVAAWIYKKIMAGLAGSGSFADGTKMFVPTIDNVLIKAGQMAGQLPKTLEAAADLNAKTGKMKVLIRKALLYPCGMITLVIAVVCWFATSVFPTMTGFVPVENWPVTSRTVYGLGLFFLNYLWIVIAVFLGIFFAIYMSFANLTGPFRIWLDRFPPYSLYRLSQGGAWIMSIASMVASGTINEKALNIVYKEANGNRWLQERTKAVRDNIAKGQNMGTALTTKFMFPDAELCDDMSDYAKSGDFNLIFEKVGKEWIETGVEKVDSQSKKLNSVFMAIFAITILSVINGIISLMMTVGSTISSSNY